MLAKETQTSAELLQFRYTSFLLQLEQLISSCFGSEVLLCLSEELAHSSFIGLLIMAWLSTVDDVTLIAIFKHFANCYVSMPIVGTCRRIFITWTRNRRQIALEELARLQSWLNEEELRNVRLLNRQDGGNVPIRVVSHALCEIRDLIR